MSASPDSSTVIDGSVPTDDADTVVRPALDEMVRFFAWLGATGFGGPIALVGYMEREFVERRRWASRRELGDGLAFAQLAPGPLAAQLAIYLGWLCGGVRGATLSGIAFVAPSFVMVVAIAALYVRLGGMPWLQGAFYGIGAAVIAIIARSAAKLARATLRRDPLQWALFAVSAGATAWTESEAAWLFVLCGALSAAIKAPSSPPGGAAGSLGMLVGPRAPDWLPAVAPHGATLAATSALFLYFVSAGLFVFGSGLAIVPFLHGGVVQQYRWLTERQFLDAVAVALITPGPVVITVAFIGFLVAGPVGAVAAAAGVFAPVYLITVTLAPHYARLKGNPRVRAFVDGVTAAATGAIAGAAVVLGRRALIDVSAVLIALATLALFLSGRKVPEPFVILAAGVAGVVMKSAVVP